MLDQEPPIGWAPVVTLILMGITMMLVVRFVGWLWNLRASRPAAATPYWPAQRPEPQMLATVETAEVPHVGAEEWRLHELRPLEELTEDTKRALTTDTMEIDMVDVVWDTDEQQLVDAMWQATQQEMNENRNLPALCVDELGEWDPDAADWLEPAAYVETLDWTLRRNPDLLTQQHKAELAYDVRTRAMAMADAILTGS